MQHQPNVLFIGTAEIAARILESLHHEKLHIVKVITQPDKAAGRKKKLVASPVKQMAQKLHLAIDQPAKIKDYEIEANGPLDLIVTCAYGQILPQRILDYPKYGCINIHGSLLPKYRGGAPIQRAIWNGETTSGITLMKMDAGLDTGDMLAQREFPIEGKNSQEVFDLMAQHGAGLLSENLDTILSGKAMYQKQDDSLASYAPIIKAQEEELDLNQSNRQILGQILALSPAPGAYVRVDGKKLKILQAQLVEEKLEKGRFKAEKKRLLLGLGDQSLKILKVLPEGKKEMEIQSYLNGAGKGLEGKKVDEIGQET